MQQFNTLDAQWAEYTNADSMRSCAQNPALLAVMDEQHVSYLRILEIGCGEGRLARALEEKYGATIVAFDSAENSIRIADEILAQHPQKIQYSVSTASEFREQAGSYEAAVSVMVIPYAGNTQELKEFFACAKYHLKPEAHFTSVIFRPEFTNFDVQVNNRIFSRINSDGMRITFLAPSGSANFSAEVQKRFSKQEYTTAAHSAGFTNVRWHPVMPVPGAEDKGEWAEYKKDPPYELIEVW